MLDIVFLLSGLSLAGVPLLIVVISATSNWGGYGTKYRLLFTSNQKLYD